MEYPHIFFYFDTDIKMINQWLWDIGISDTLALGLSLCPLELPDTFALKLAMGLARKPFQLSAQALRW